MDANGNISLLIMKELEDVVEDEGTLPQALNENQVDLKDWKEMNPDKVPLEAKVDDMVSIGETEIDVFLQQAMINEMESPVKDKICELVKAKAKNLKVEIDSKKSGELEINHDEIDEHCIKHNSDGVFTEKLEHKEILAESEADTKISPAELARLWTQKQGQTSLGGSNTEKYMQNDVEENYPHILKNDIYGISHKDYGRVPSKDLDQILIYEDPGKVLHSSAQLKKMQENTVFIWQQLTKWVSGMALCKTCEKAFPAGHTKILLRHVESKHKEELSSLRLEKFNGNYKTGTILEYKAKSVPESRKKCGRAAMLKIFTFWNSDALVCKYCDHTHKKQDSLFILTHIKGKHRAEFMNFEKENVIEQSILCSLPTFEELEKEAVYSIQDDKYDQNSLVIKKKYKVKEGKECKCGEIFSTHRQLEAHINRIHMRTNMIVCIECGLELYGKMEERRHKTRVHRTTQFPCNAEGCKKVFRYKSTLNAHFDRTHLGIPTPKNHSCDDCGKAFDSNAKLNQHISVDHLLLRPFVCKECGKSFKRRKDVWAHKEVHSTTNKFICPFCDKGFKNHGALWNHKKLHT